MHFRCTALGETLVSLGHKIGAGPLIILAFIARSSSQRDGPFAPKRLHVSVSSGKRSATARRAAAVDWEVFEQNGENPTGPYTSPADDGGDSATAGEHESWHETLARAMVPTTLCGSRESVGQ